MDFLCRYGGDEFAISSIRHADDSIALGEKMVEDISGIEIDALPEGVSATFGMAGGRRTREREDIHYAATLDDLINRASQNCTANKPHKAEEAAPVTAATTAQIQEQPLEAEPQYPSVTTPLTGRARLKIARISVSSAGSETSIDVEINQNGRKFSHNVSGYTVAGRNALRLAAEAAAGAVSKSMEAGYGVVVDQVFTFEPARDQQVVSVTAIFVTPQNNISHVGSALVRRGDIYRAAVAALLSAVNRLVEIAPQTRNGDTPKNDTPEENQTV
jgi:hypothetical protein